MAKRPMMFGRMTVNRFPAFQARVEGASMRHLDAAGRAGSAETKRAWTRNRTGETKRKIGWSRKGKEGIIYLGTFQGNVQDAGTKERAGPRGSVEPLGALRQGLIASIAYLERYWKA